MTETRDFDRLARAWLELMPEEAPDRVIDAVLQAVDRLPQRQAPVGVAIRRFFQMNRLTYAAVALAIVVLGGGALALTVFKGPTVGPSSAPSGAPIPTSASTPAIADLDADLVGDWLGAPRALKSSLYSPAAGTHLLITSRAVKVTQSNQQTTTLFSVSAGALADGKVSVSGAGAASDAGCGSDVAPATYSATLSPSGETLTITSISEECANRAAAIGGVWWKADCKEGPCYGNMDPGTYKSEYFLNGMQSQTDWSSIYGALEFTVPAGWAEAVDAPTHVVLVPSSEYAKWTVDGPPTPDSAGIAVYTQPRAMRNPASCPETPEVDPSIGTRASDLARFLRSNPDLDVQSAASMTIDGHTATVLDLRMKASSKVSCWGTGPSEDFLATPFGGDFAWYSVGSAAGVRTRLVLVDLGPNSVVGIAVQADDASWDAVLHDATRILQSFHFK